MCFLSWYCCCTGSYFFLVSLKFVISVNFLKYIFFITKQTTEALTTEALTVQNIKATNASVTSVYIGDTTTADFNSMLTSELSPAIITQSTSYTVKEIFSLTLANRNIAISTETSTPVKTGIEQVANIYRLSVQLLGI